MEDKYAIDKSYEFMDSDNSGTTISIQLTHEEVIDFAEAFMDEDYCEVDGSIKDLLDQANADCIAENLFEQWKELDDEGKDLENEERELEDFYDKAWLILGESVLYYVWSPEFKQDCLDYYKRFSESN